jgi:hypothetical protein
MQNQFKDDSPRKRVDRQREAQQQFSLEKGHIVEALRYSVGKQAERFWQVFDDACSTSQWGMDDVCQAELDRYDELVRHFPRPSALANNMLDEELKRLGDHAMCIYRKYHELMRRARTAPNSVAQTRVELTQQLRQYPGERILHLLPDAVEKYLALRVYRLGCPGEDHGTAWRYEFPFYMAHDTLMHIKASSPRTARNGHHVVYAHHTTMSHQFGDCSILKTSLVKALDRDFIDE